MPAQIEESFRKAVQDAMPDGMTPEELEQPETAAACQTTALLTLSVLPASYALSSLKWVYVSGCSRW